MNEKILNLKIRNCRENDIKGCAELYIEVFKEPPYNDKWKINGAIKYLKRFLGFDKNNCYLALLYDKIIAASFGYIYPGKDFMSYYIHELFVKKEYRRKGIAKSLVDYALKRLGNKVSLSLIANERTDAAKFYENLGLSQHKYYKFYTGKIKK